MYLINDSEEDLYFSIKYAKIIIFRKGVGVFMSSPVHKCIINGFLGFLDFSGNKFKVAVVAASLSSGGVQTISSSLFSIFTKAQGKENT